MIVMQRAVKVDGKVRTDVNFPSGFMDVIEIERTNEHFRILYDVKGRFAVHRITPEEAKFKLVKIRRVLLGPKGVPFAVTHDGRTLRYPHPDIKVSDVVKLDTATQKVEQHLRFEVGSRVMVTGGRNTGRIGIVERREKHPGSHEIVHIRDAANNDFATREENVFTLGEGKTSLVSVPRGSGVKLTILEQKEALAKKAASTA